MMGNLLKSIYQKYFWCRTYYPYKLLKFCHLRVGSQNCWLCCCARVSWVPTLVFKYSKGVSSWKYAQKFYSTEGNLFPFFMPWPPYYCIRGRCHKYGLWVCMCERERERVEHYTINLYITCATFAAITNWDKFHLYCSAYLYVQFSNEVR